ncbi:aminotransferase class III-fold pyridoxal phosphate-dependent enzyme, partial [Candidatus Pelagibacter ubique]|nr:aminotransferase class III-fold pyridoxal phosphate-dependent enzyme [Candidatus Pelagibacter ubique]
MSALAKNYNRKKISFKYGKGSFLYSTNGKKYLDFVQGIAVNSLGHANPYLIKAVNKQSKKLWHVSNAFIIPEGEKLAKRLAKKLLQILLFSKIVEQKPQKQQLK